MKQALLCFAFLIFGFLSGCGRENLAKKDAVAYANKEPVTASELKREIALRARQDPTFKITPETEREQLDAIINRKLIIQEAMEKGLAREERFVNTIKAFWEQTLIRDFIDYKMRTFKDYLFVTDDEVKQYYGNISKTENTETRPLEELRPGIEQRILAAKERQLFEQWLTEKRKNAKIKIIGR